MCQDNRCTDGITACMGPNGCNGWGVLSPKGGKYRQRREYGKPFPEWAVAHHECNGTGLRHCGCKPRLNATEKATLKGAAWKKDEQRWSTNAAALVGKPAPKPRTRPTVAATTTKPAPKPAPRQTPAAKAA